MLEKRSLVKTYVEIDKSAARHNLKEFRKITGGRSKIMAVVKSNAYGHGIFSFSGLLADLGVDGFGVDSLIEGEHLRKFGIKQPMLVLGYTFPSLFPVAKKQNLTLTISSWENLKALSRLRNNRPNFHLKVDTGMHRQGFFPKDIPAVAKFVERNKLPLKGVYTHFSSAKDINYPTYTREQFGKFLKAERILSSGRRLECHVAATGGTLVDSEYHLDWVRPGIGLYGLWPSKELEVQLSDKINLKPVLSWRAVVSEVKDAGKGSFVGYDIVERLSKKTRLAVLPVGYWHGIPRSLSGIGSVIIRGKKARILGRVSMDMIVADVSGIRAKPGDVATIIGKNGKEELRAADVAEKSGTTHYEFLTRINPLIERVVTKS